MEKKKSDLFEELRDSGGVGGGRQDRAWRPGSEFGIGCDWTRAVDFYCKQTHRLQAIQNERDQF